MYIDLVEDNQMTFFFYSYSHDIKVCINYVKIMDAVQMNFLNSANSIFFLESAQYKKL